MFCNQISFKFYDKYLSYFEIYIDDHLIWQFNIFEIYIKYTIYRFILIVHQLESVLPESPMYLEISH